MPDFDIELPACFYLGREYDLGTRTAPPERPPVMLDARDLTTHGVVVGMTGSGKTGLSLCLLEEAAIDGIPGILIDPKGDLTNLLLQFPDLAPADFRPWVNPDDARARKLTPDALAAETAERWRGGITESLQNVERVKLLKESAEWRIYTPGSESGLPLSVLRTFAAPPADLPRENLHRRIDATASALLGLGGIDADPVQSREHILIAQLLLHAWSKGESLDLKQLIGRIQTPPLAQVGALDVDDFFPPKDRQKLAVALNNILAAPGFATWIGGEPLDLGTLLGSGPKPRQLIFYLAHLDDAQRSFFITLLLEEVLAWTRRQPAATTLKALVYFDEVFGYLPPHPLNPPTKLPLLTLLKQARAFGVGILLATQNPVDLDYKALSNAGTWFVGKLQTERDKARLIEGLEGVSAERGTLTDRAYLENVISALGQRVFLLHDVHRPKPVLFQTRQALSYLCGPLSLDQVGQLMAPFKKSAEPPTGPPPMEKKAADTEFRAGLRGAPSTDVLTAGSPQVPTGVAVVYLPVDAPAARPTQKPTGTPVAAPTAAAELTLIYRPRLLGEAEVQFVDRRRGLELRRSYRLMLEAPEQGESVNWTRAEAVVRTTDVGESTAQWAPLPEAFDSARKLKSAQKELEEHIYRSARLELFENGELKLVSTLGEDGPSFQERCRAAALKAGEAELATARSALVVKCEKLGIPAPADRPPAPPEQPSWLWKMPVFSLFKPGPEEIRLGPGLSPKAAATAQKLYDAWKNQQAEIAARWQHIGEERDELRLTPRRVDVKVLRIAVAWAPFWRVERGGGLTAVTPAYPKL